MAFWSSCWMRQRNLNSPDHKKGRRANGHGGFGRGLHSSDQADGCFVFLR
ncbi:hypothetical protein GGD57_004698 [Rhizobium esperanzae]|uniref:Uncharacterized protein n=1 Tax=Rhizobium esperanzae TaxID=1967781 RepID=A0A7W6W6U6_9HYPH|nr:hypothetical protein [Rhizobium esperanzae]